MSNQPPYPGSPDQGPEEPPTRHKGGDPQQGNPQQGNPQQGNPQQGNPYGGPPQQHNPYGQPPQQNPYGQPPQQGNPYGGPPQQHNPYGQPPQQNPYGQPPQGNPYGGRPPQGQPNQPVWQGHQAPQQGYGPGGQQQWQQGQYAPGGQQKSKKKWLVPVVAIVVILLVVGGVFGILALTGDDSSGTAVDDLSEGDCLVSSDIADASDSIGDIETVDCGDDHDAEVFATFEVGGDEAGGDFDLEAAGSACVDELSGAGTTLDDLETDGNEVRPLVGSDEPSEGDQVVCFIRNSDGDQLSDSVLG